MNVDEPNDAVEDKNENDNDPEDEETSNGEKMENEAENDEKETDNYVSDNVPQAASHQDQISYENRNNNSTTEHQSNEESKSAEELQNSTNDKSAGSSREKKSKENSLDDKTMQQSLDKNPIREMPEEEIVERWQKTLNDVLHGQDEEDRDKDGEKGDQFEYVKDNEETCVMQDLNDEENTINPVCDDSMEDEEREKVEAEGDDFHNEEEREIVPSEIDKKGSQDRQNEEKAEKEKTEIKSGSLDLVLEEIEAMEAVDSGQSEGDEIFDHEDESMENIEDIRQRFEQRLFSGDSTLKWIDYQRLTMPFSFELIEQLRLILESNVASSMKGDYKTGKRLNMRKIVPYIASDFKKDKIWLRKTKMSKRSYDIVLSLDDSISMKNDPHLVNLAFESMALITQALTFLGLSFTVGKFGEKMDILSYPNAFNGDDMLKAMTFEQQKTDLKRLFGAIPEIFSGESNDYKLHLVLSDGLCDDHEYLKSKVLYLLEKERIITVFVVLKAKLVSKMNKVTYVDSKMKIVNYLDTFPFEYYVMVDVIDELPSILANTIKQYFEIVKNA
jgi:midasin (ATPase involved in ribosome maturation)